MHTAKKAQLHQEPRTAGKITLIPNVVSSCITPNHSNLYLSSKRIFDLAVASIVLTTCLPFLFLIALVVVFDSPGNALFLQQRVGANGKRFKMFKFRTMRIKSEGESHVTRSNDPRITRFGEFLRKSKLDELPQLLNVIFGEMSIIGPRPLSAVETDLLTSDFGVNYPGLVPRVTPGLVGLEQINRGRALSYSERFELNSIYERTASWSIDCKILFWSIFQCRQAAILLTAAVAVQLVVSSLYIGEGFRTPLTEGVAFIFNQLSGR